jgi:DNA polymerase III subunit epsilon
VGLWMGDSSRKAAVQKAKEYLSVRPVFLDTETTGLDGNAEIVEICAIDHDGSILVDTLVKPTRRIPSDAVRIHGITNEMVASAPDWPDAWLKVEAVLQNRYAAIYNDDFDIRMLKQTHRNNGMAWQPPFKRTLDVMKLYADFRDLPRWVSLEVAGGQCGIPLPNSHRALADTRLLREIFLVIANWKF